MADAFIFPTIYEPFGLVLIEAAAMGMEIFTTKENVGAAEILYDMEKIHLFSGPDEMVLSQIKPISTDERKNIIDKRIDILKKYDWKQTAESFLNVLK